MAPQPQAINNPGFHLLPAAAPVETTLAVFVDGERVGEVRKTNINGWYHAVLEIQSGEPCFRVGLAQGHGKTPEEAIRKAVVSGRTEAESYLLTLNALALKLGMECASE